MRRGHIARKGRAFYVVVEDADPVTGKRKRRWHSGFKTKTEAEDGLERILGEKRSGSYVPPSADTFGAFVEEWFSGEVSLRPGTRSLYRTIATAYLLPHLGTVPLQSLRPSTLQALYAKLLLEGGRGGRPLAPKTVKNVHGVIHRMGADAMRWGRLARNPAEHARPPARARREMKTWTPQEMGRFLRRVHHDRLRAAWLLVATTGLRRGELLAARWSDLDLDAARLEVRRALVLVDCVPTFSEPKTATGNRSVPLAPMTVTALREHRVHQLEERLAAGPAYMDADLIFAREDGTPIHPEWFSRRFADLTAEAGLPKIRLHDVRHSWATAALRAGEHPKVVQEILGHSSIAMTLDTYSHVIPAMKSQAVDRVADLIFGP